jgi:hypothetical protein
MSVQVINIRSTFENLDDSSLADDFEDLTFPAGTITDNTVDDFSLFWEFDVIADD